MFPRRTKFRDFPDRRTPIAEISRWVIEVTDWLLSWPLQKQGGELMPEAPRGGKSTAHPGAMLKGIRADRGWTLAQVSERTGLPIGTLSKIENEKISLSYDKLIRISDGLGIDISSLFGAKSKSALEFVSTGRRSITRSGDGSAIETTKYSHLYLAADLLNKQIVPIIAELKARSLLEFGPLIRHGGEEYAMVLNGVVEFHTELYAPVLLNKGDSIYFDSGMAHGYIAASHELCRVLSVCSSADLSSAHFAADAGQPADTRKPSVMRST
jgi:transcriptional regulator with XRE-family HTH domain